MRRRYGISERERTVARGEQWIEQIGGGPNSSQAAQAQIRSHFLSRHPSIRESGLNRQYRERRFGVAGSWQWGRVRVPRIFFANLFAKSAKNR